jgi:hypothetical protein
MFNTQAHPEPGVHDADLLQRLEGSSPIVHDIVLRQCVAEQQRRDLVSALPVGSRRRAELRHKIEEQGAITRENLRHIHSVLAICSLPYTAQPLHVREWERKQGK